VRGLTIVKPVRKKKGFTLERTSRIWGETAKTEAPKGAVASTQIQPIRQ